MKQEYYFSQMNKDCQAAYRAMLAGFLNIDSEFAVPRLSDQELTDIFFRLRLDHPEIFYACGFGYRYTDVSEYVQLLPKYMFEKKKVREHQKALEGRVNRLIRPAQTLPDVDKEKYIHDFICANVTYDKLKKQYSHEIIGPLQQGIGVCEGIAKTVKLLCDRLGLECIIAISEANPQKGIRYRHAWNVIRLGKTWYHLDATFDNSLGRYGAPRFDYFNLDDKKLFLDHQPLIYPVPACGDGNHFYYKENRLSLTKPEDVGKRLAAVFRKKKPYFVFHWRGGALSRDLLEQFLNEAQTMALERGLFVRVSVNVPQSVVEISISEKPFVSGICKEEADEGA